LTHPHSNSSRAELRRQLRAARRRLLPAERRTASLRAVSRLLSHPWYRRARSIALYWPVGSETDTSALFAAARQEGKQIFLPSIFCRGLRLLFVRLRPGTNLKHRRHGIPQPRLVSSRDLAATRHLDMVVVPLLGFDDKGHRLGSGAGYYDRSFGFRKFSPQGKPRLVGLAFACQQIKTFEPDNWDVALDAVVTENGWFYPQG
ncbi:MAG: 5-formyltetrahydrofolate cyclo-ligase, partial [Nevskiales bacterium]